MEKFTVCDDLQNGCNPFRPKLGKRRKCGAKLLRLPVLLLLVPLRVILGGVAALLLAVFSLIPVQPVRRLADLVFLRVILVCLGFWTIEGVPANVRKLGIGTRRRSRGVTEEGISFAAGIGRGHVVIANYSSALEVILLSYWLSTPRFAFPVARRREAGADGRREEVDVIVLGFLAALRQACGSQETLQALGAKAVPLETAVVENRGGPLVVLAEGSRTNGTCVMPFQLFDPAPAPEGDAAGADACVAADDSKVAGACEGKAEGKWVHQLPVHLLATTYSFVSYNPAGDPAVPLAKGLWALATEVSNSVTGIHLHHQVIKSPTVLCHRRALQEWLARIQQDVGVVRNVDATMHQLFLDIYYNRSNSGSKFSLAGGGGAGQPRREKTQAERDRERFH